MRHHVELLKSDLHKGDQINVVDEVWLQEGVADVDREVVHMWIRL